MRRLILLCVVWMAVSAALAGGASAASPAQSPVVTDCVAHDRLTGSYSISELQNALNTMPGTTQEYSGCYDIIQRQLFAQAGGKPSGGSSSGSGGSFLPTPVIVILVVLALGAVTFGAIAIRSRSGGPPGGPE
jgi:ABC-type phosphate transport system substrate-binding protein